MTDPSGTSSDAAFAAAQAEFGRRVREVRQAQSKSLEALAEGSSLHWSNVARIERGQGNVTLRSLLRLADALGVDAGSLVAGLETDV
ncbi:helix-turn-helix domain-containing protein [Nocardioides sp.]|uniref:helix-turn-helix domain-containing protein n=1 Tax=Nocardioides sp. TaxID=35761 RepID=UPI002718F2A6|nr:helix-turn-helix transcriptional regulator [Nocardioides sp.]MDO9455237.1 helix-turn-helix transcriptional regulator [Nocardioides sp.]